MRILLTILSVLIFGVTFTQTRPTGFPATKTTTWYEGGYVMGDSGVIIGKRDTFNFFPRFTGTLVTRPQDRRPYFYDSVAGQWLKFSFAGDVPTGNFFTQNGNTFSDTARLGTNDNFPLLFKTNNIRRAIFNTNGQFGLGTLSPAALIDINGVTIARDTVKVTNVIEVGNSSINGLINIRRESDAALIGQIFANGAEMNFTGLAGTVQINAGMTPKITVRTSGVTIGQNSNASFPSVLEQAYLILQPGDTATNRGAPLKFTLDGARVLNTKQRGVMEAMSNYLMWTDSLLNRDTLGTRRWVRQNFSGGVGAPIVARGGLTKRNDTMFLAGTLDSFQLIRTYTRKNIPLGPAIPFTGLVIANTADSLEIPFLVNGTTSDRSLLYLHKYYYPDDTANASYGGLLSGITRIHMDPNQKTYISPSRPYFWTYSGFNIASQIRNPDSMNIQIGPFGHTGGSNMEQAIGGDQAKYWINGFSQTNISSPYPLSAYRAGLDLARVSSLGKRETYGPGYAGYIWDWRNHQPAINAGSTEYGSYVGRVTGFYAYGLLSTQSTSPSKAKTLAVSTADTVIGVRIAPMWGATNEVKNGYSVVAEGTSDMAHFAGQLKVGGVLPLFGAQVSQFQVDDTIPRATFGPASFIDASANVGTYVLQNGVTTANIASKKTRGMYVWKETRYDGLVNLNGRFQLAYLGYNVHAADSGISMSANGNGDVSGSQFALALRKKTGWTDTTFFVGGTTARNAPTAISGLLDVSGAPANVTQLNWYRGNWSVITAIINFNAWQRMDNANWITTGGGAAPGSNSQIDTGAALRILQLDTRVLNKFAIRQDGTSDTVLFNGVLRLPNVAQLSLDTTNYKIAVFDSRGILYKSFWPTAGGGSGTVTSFAFTDGSGFDGTVSTATTTPTLSLTTTLTNTHIPVIGASGALTGSSAFLNDGTSVKQENALASYSGTSTTTLGSTSGFDFRAFVKATPTGANNRMAGYMAGTLDGGSTENITGGLQFFSTAAHTPGSSEQTYATMSVTATNALAEVMRWTSNLRVGIGTTTIPSTLTIAAGNASVNPFALTLGTDMTTPTNGSFAYSAISGINRLAISLASNTYKRFVVTNDVAPANGQIPIGNATDFTVATPTVGTSGTDFGITPGAGTLVFNLPDASTTARGVVSITSQTFNGQKTMDDGLIVQGSTISNTARLQIVGNNTFGALGSGNAANLLVDVMTYTDGGTAGSGTVSGQRQFNIFGNATLAATNSSVTYTDVSNLYIAEPLAGTNITITHARSLYAAGIGHISMLANDISEGNAATATLGKAGHYIFTGTTTTVTLPDLATYKGAIYFIKNAGSGNITLQRAGSDQLYDVSAVTSITIAPGSARVVVAGLAFWYIE